MPEDLIRYDIIIQDALRSAVKKILTEVGRTGLPGEHHFYIAFDTTAPGVRISNRLRERYPQEMTVVLQHQFWDLVITEHTFEVGLSFGGVPERLLVPFSSIKGFFDPSVQFALEFEPGKTAEELPADVVAAGDAARTLTDVEKLTLANADDSADEDVTPIAAARAASDDETASDADMEASGEEGEAEAKPDAKPDTGADVVSLDAFRKKN
ncbi:ClpXP protease specificity-enhancing factor SspB [Breoghania sp.]|uniref:SspB family protein n=1 Tax=Breoghania sp. TaxID=2065378 RepID=UPI002AA5E597|nr:ClpXP protease specificity-enhancing factor SspB [Breoghania sp.]